MKKWMQIMPLTALLVAATAQETHADLIGSEMLIDVLHSGLINGNAGGTYQYGHTQSFFTELGFELIVSSPVEAVGYDNAVSLDFSNFYYADIFTDTVGQVTMSEIDEAVMPDSVAILAGGIVITSGAVTFENAFIATWNANDLMAATSDDGPMVTIAWNSVPAPGTLALLGLAGFTGRPRRRR